MNRLLMAMTALAALVLTAAPAIATSRIISTVPAAGSTVTTSLSEIALEFGAPIEAGFAEVQILDSAGTRIASGDPQITGKMVKVALTPQPAGDYTVAYRILSGDSHPVESRFAFNYQPPAAAAAETGGLSLPGAGAESDGAGADDSWWAQYRYFVIGGAIFLLVALVVMRPGSKEPLQEARET